MAGSFVTIQDYSEALEELIAKVFKAGNVIYSPVQLIWEQYSKQKNNEIKFPFISFFPSTDWELDLQNTSQPEYRLGVFPEEIDDKRSKRSQTFKLNLTYYFEVVAQERQTAEQILIELLFWFQRNQQVTLKREEDEYDFTFLIDPTITDNSNYDNYKQERYDIQIHCTNQYRNLPIPFKNVS